MDGQQVYLLKDYKKFWGNTEILNITKLISRIKEILE